MLRVTGVRRTSVALSVLCIGLTWIVQPPDLQAERPVDSASGRRVDRTTPHEEANGLLAGFRAVGKPKPSAEPNSDSGSSVENMVKDRQGGTSSKAVRELASAALPLNKLTPRNQQRANDILRSVSLFRRLPTVVFEVDPQIYMYFAEHPDVAVSIWRALDISSFQMWQTGKDEYEADASDGTVGIIDVLFQGAEQILILCEGSYKSPFISKPIKARALIHLQTSFFREGDGTVFATHRADLFVSFPSQTVETIAKVVSPVGNMIADRNFREISVFLHLMSLAMCKQPGWVERLTPKLEGILEVRKTELLDLTAKAYVAARKRELAGTTAGGEASVQDVLPPGAPARETAVPPTRAGFEKSRSGTPQTENAPNRHTVPTVDAIIR